MRIGIFAKSFAGDDPMTVLRVAAAAGYSAVQYNMACSGIGALPEAISPKVAAAVRAASRATGVEISAVSATYNMTDPDPVRRAAGRRAFRAIAAAAAAMGTRLVTVCSGSLDAQDQWRAHPGNDSAEAWAEMLAEFALLLPLAEAQDLMIGVEPELANIVSSAARARALIDTLGSDRIGIVLDPANLFEVGTAVDRARVIGEAVDLLGDRIVMAHAKDRAADGRFVAAGQGVIDFPGFLTSLRRAGFDGPLITHGLDAGEAQGVARFLAQAAA
jgi:sugar phosphate isomerase/epimerase